MAPHPLRSAKATGGAFKPRTGTPLGVPVLPAHATLSRRSSGGTAARSATGGSQASGSKVVANKTPGATGQQSEAKRHTRRDTTRLPITDYPSYNGSPYRDDANKIHVPMVNAIPKCDYVQEPISWIMCQKDYHPVGRFFAASAFWGGAAVVGGVTGAIPAIAAAAAFRHH